MSAKEPVGHITVITRERPIEGFKYRVDIAIDEKPDYSKVEADIKKRWGEKTEPDAQMIWEHVLIQARHPEQVDLWKLVEPVTDKITDILLIASATVGGYKWYRVRLFVLTDEPLDLDELKEKHGEMGSGYPSDPKTQAFFKDWLKKNNGERPSWTRKSWSSWERWESGEQELLFQASAFAP